MAVAVVTAAVAAAAVVGPCVESGVAAAALAGTSGVVGIAAAAAAAVTDGGIGRPPVVGLPWRVPWWLGSVSLGSSYRWPSSWVAAAAAWRPVR